MKPEREIWVLSKLGRDGKIADDEYIYESKTVKFIDGEEILKRPAS
jgi:hypothetical protein